MTVALYGETFAIDARFHNSIGGLEEVIAVRLYMETDQSAPESSTSSRCQGQMPNASWLAKEYARKLPPEHRLVSV